MKKSVSDGRAAALEVLLLLEKGLAVQAALDSYLRGASLKIQDRALCTELVYGFLRAEIRINHILHKLLPNPRKLPREMFLAMALALYALLFLERIPVHATVNWTVGHVRQRFGQGIARVANGALRAFVRLGDAPKQPDYYLPIEARTVPAQIDPSSASNAAPSSTPTAKPNSASSSAPSAALLQRDSLFYSVPLWIVKLWHTSYGAEDCTALLKRSQAAPHSCVRVNALSPQADLLREAFLAPAAPPKEESAVAESPQGIGPQDKQAHSILPQAETLGLWGIAFAPGCSPRSIANAPLSYWQQQGDISFQSAGSQSAMNALEPRTWPQPVWDMCAGQGGKSALLLEQGVKVALCSDVHVQRLESFTGNIQRITSAFAAPVAEPSSPALVRELLEKVQQNSGESPHCLPYIPPKNIRKIHDSDADAQECAPTARNPLPVVALVDGCFAPADIWPGTILVDAPCSGLGVLSRRPDIRRRAQNLDEMVRLQARLLECAWQALQVGGALVYMTCTLNPAENENQIAALQNKYPQLQLVRQWQTPHSHPWLEGMYAALCVKAPEAQSL